MSVFTEMIEGTRPAIVVAEDGAHIAFMEPNPNARGHVICLPKTEHENLFALDEPAYLALMRFARSIAQAIEAVVPCQKVGMASIGLAVAHVHIHLVPLNQAKEMNFIDKVTVSAAEQQSLGQMIATEWQEKR
ncbi:HIT family protein [Suttonella sp. R2A3]|uniref:HIT family protein n=1 Tax=Suttonella sp. R2A3 TaxID=2908648 RepID=UPI001F2B77A0|nr:HIT family protein [Suttonella sp. R2A3]UJF24161.1 HIT family protein [Suttonella sp. R2A3]